MTPYFKVTLPSGKTYPIANDFVTTHVDAAFIAKIQENQSIYFGIPAETMISNDLKKCRLN